MFLIEFPNIKDYHGQEVNFLQPKYDGHLAKIYKAEKVTILTKNDKDITEKLYSCSEVAKIISLIPEHSILFGELFSQGAATDVPTLLKQRSKFLQLRIFAAPIFKTKNLWNRDLLEVQTIIESAGIPFAPTKLVKEVDTEMLLQTAVLEGLEGWVLKKSHLKNWYKLKPIRTLDAFVIVAKKSFSANNFGELQSCTVGIYNGDKIKIIADVGGGYSKEFRASCNLDDLKDRVMEIEYDSFAKNKLRFPRFLRWREDKDSKNCTVEQLSSPSSGRTHLGPSF